MTSQIPESIVQAWEELLLKGNGEQKLLSIDHPLKIYFGDGDNGEPIFFVRSKRRLRKPEVSAAVQVFIGQRYDGDWALTFSLTEARFSKTFMSLCWDLAQRSKDEPNEEAALAQFITALGEWKRLMTFHDSDTLSEEAVRGLLAEMWFGFFSGHLEMPVDQIQQGWTGPMGSDQDYRFPRYSYEVKSIHGDSTTVKISSAEQLDAGSTALDLVLVTLTEVPEPVQGSWTLRGIIDAVDQLHSADLLSREKLIHKLETELRVDRYHPYYSEHHYYPASYSTYSVTADFPAVRASEVSLGLSDISYSLAIHSISEFQTHSSEALPPSTQSRLGETVE